MSAESKVCAKVRLSELSESLGVAPTGPCAAPASAPGLGVGQRNNRIDEGLGEGRVVEGGLFVR